MRMTPYSRPRRSGRICARLGWVVANLAALAVIAYFVGGCNGSTSTQTSISSQNSQTATRETSRTQLNAQTTSTSTPATGQTNTSTISAVTTGAKRDALAKYIWTPPFDFIQAYRFPNRQPDHPEGPPPFVFSNIPLVSATQFEPVQVEYDWPALPPGVDSMRGVETIQLLVPGEAGEPNPIHFCYTLSASPKDRPPSKGEARLDPVAPSDKGSYDFLAYNRWIDGTSPMTPGLCEKYVEAFNNGLFFYAIQMPAVIVPGSPDAYTLPFASNGEDLRSRAELQNWSGQPVTGFDATLDRAPQYLTCLENQLPREDGMHWLALAANTPVLDQCAAFPLTSQWSILLTLYFQREILDRELLTYTCYRGDNPLLKALCARAADDLGLELLEKDDADCCLTCLGPIPMQVTQDFARMELHNAGANIYVQPLGQRVAFIHYLTNSPSPATLEYSYLSDNSGLQWGFYKNVNNQYDLSQPLTQAGANFSSFWFVSEPVTGAVSKGQYTMKITATAANRAQVWTTDFINVGELTGDLNLDDLLDALDLVLMANLLADNVRLSGEALARADVDYDHKIGVSDRISMEKMMTH